MGVRGPMATKTIADAERLNDLACPDWLVGDAKDFWNKHAQPLANNNLLNVQTACSFAILCDYWAQLRALPHGKAKLEVCKQYQSLARLFYMVPVGKPGLSTTAARHDEKTTFEW